METTDKYVFGRSGEGRDDLQGLRRQMSKLIDSSGEEIMEQEKYCKKCNINKSLSATIEILIEKEINTIPIFSRTMMEGGGSAFENG